MVDLLLAVLATTVLATVGLTALAGVTVVPFVLALRQAEAKGLSSGRVGAAAAGSVLVGLALVAATLLLDAPAVLVLPALAAVYAVPALLRVLDRPQLLGAAGRHE